MASITEQWQKVQDDFYIDAKKHTHLLFKPNSTYAKLLTDQMVRGLSLSNSDIVLDIGAGAGRFTLHLAPYCKKVVALDTSQALLGALERQSAPGTNLDIACASVFDLPLDFGPSSFDAISGFFILHHIPNHVKLFELIFDTLKSGGRLGFLEPNRLNPLFLLQVMFSREMTWEAEKGMFTFSASTTTRILRDVGFINIQIKRSGFFPPQLLDNIPGISTIQKGLEWFSPIRRFLPFVLINAQKP